MALYNPSSQWIRIALANINFELCGNRLRSIPATREKIEKVLGIASEHKPDIVIFPEYSADESFDELYSNYAVDQQCAVIAGTCVRDVFGKKYNTCSIFNIKGGSHQIMKRHLTPFENVGNYATPFQDELHNENLRLELRFGEIDVLIKICLDFIIEDHFRCERPDIVFVPLYNDGDEKFEESAINFAFHHSTFVIGLNIGGKENFSTIGGWNSNRQSIEAFRHAELLVNPYKPSSCMKYYSEKLVILELDLATPVIPSHGQAHQGCFNTRIFQNIPIE